MYDPTSASDLRGGTFVRSASGAAVQRASPSTALPTTPDEGHGPGEEDAEARAAAAAAAVVDDATDDEGDDDDELADAVIRAAVAGRTPISFLTDGTLTPAATTAAAPGAAGVGARDQAVRRAAVNNNGSPPLLFLGLPPVPLPWQQVRRRGGRRRLSAEQWCPHYAPVAPVPGGQRKARRPLSRASRRRLRHRGTPSRE